MNNRLTKRRSRYFSCGPVASHPRRGTLMVCVIVCMAVVASLVAMLAKDAISARRETKLRFQMLQTERLLDAGILRSALQGRQNTDYDGETWRPKLQMAGRDANASVTISNDRGQTTVTARIGTQPHITSQSYVYPSSQVQ